MDKVKIVCRALISDSTNRLLLTKKTGSDFWSLPGGKLESGDTSVQDCLLREIKEEIGAEVKLGAVAHVHELHKKNIRYVEIIWNANLVDSVEFPFQDISITSGGELSDIQWFSKDEIRDIDVRPALLQGLDITS